MNEAMHEAIKTAIATQADKTDREERAAAEGARLYEAMGVEGGTFRVLLDGAIVVWQDNTTPLDLSVGHVALGCCLDGDGVPIEGAFFMMGICEACGHTTPYIKSRPAEPFTPAELVALAGTMQTHVQRCDALHQVECVFVNAASFDQDAAAVAAAVQGVIVRRARQGLSVHIEAQSLAAHGPGLMVQLVFAMGA